MMNRQIWRIRAKMVAPAAHRPTTIHAFARMAGGMTKQDPGGSKDVIQTSTNGRDKVSSSRRVDAGFDIENLPTFAFDDVPSLTHLLLDKQRDLRRYLRLIEYEMPRLRESVLGKRELEFVPPDPKNQPILLRSMHYLTESGHPAGRKAVITVLVDDLGLNQDELHKFILLAGPRFDPSKRSFKMSCEIFPALRMNAKWCSDVFERVLQEAKKNPGEFKEVTPDLRHHTAKLMKDAKARRNSGGGLGIRQFPKTWLPGGRTSSIERRPSLAAPGASRSFCTSSSSRRFEGRIGRQAEYKDSPNRGESRRSSEFMAESAVALADGPASSNEPSARRTPSKRVGKIPKFLADPKADRLSSEKGGEVAAAVTNSPVGAIGVFGRSTRSFEPGETYHPIDLSIDKTSLQRQHQKFDRLTAYKPPPLSVDPTVSSMISTGGRRPDSETGSQSLVDPFKALDLDPRLEWRNTVLLSEYVTEMGRIKNQRVTGLSWKSQRYVGRAIRRARAMALLPKFYKLYPNRRVKE